MLSDRLGKWRSFVVGDGVEDGRRVNNECHVAVENPENELQREEFGTHCWGLGIPLA